MWLGVRCSVGWIHSYERMAGLEMWYDGIRVVSNMMPCQLLWCIIPHAVPRRNRLPDVFELPVAHIRCGGRVVGSGGVKNFLIQHTHIIVVVELGLCFEGPLRLIIEFVAVGWESGGHVDG